MFKFCTLYVSCTPYLYQVLSSGFSKFKYLGKLVLPVAEMLHVIQHRLNPNFLLGFSNNFAQWLLIILAGAPAQREN